ncbi:hypothetical protein COCSUDRAFT_59764 [Coccomyxa subellipsoidea C-169]|uniref:Uncharacterized protein n=1 Tax=Coccomyxa subellipsoidea (strain C-169) TaxID=574566 RepID=I0YKB4_COCSC|nr:hypothetical protein COCSUDRAFT_59764 [Coccomyxa subellipsoidea C-169]EIE18833.1 hypothetical protein COCSUDRAFT_59764 [Coccomyxa subellipsoidea C-169]|eukprot:XP_005643377.1 hypothetical protein COCSUDRAFT_59764 [Coccomyxa subellipsoidea C-169]
MTPTAQVGGFSEQSSDVVNLASPTFRAAAQSVNSKAPRERAVIKSFTRTPNSEDADSFGFMTPGVTATPASASFQQATPEQEVQDIWQPAFDNAGASAHQAADAESYMMGQRAALMDAFKLALPGQSQLGGMVRDLHRLQSQVDEERLHARHAESSLAEVATKVQGLADRFTTLETHRLPDMDNRIERASTALISQARISEFHATLDMMNDALARISERKESPGGYIFGGGGGGNAAGGGGLSSSLIWLLQTAAGYARRSLSQADVAAVFLSRRILLDRAALQGSGMPREAAAEGNALGLRLRAAARPALGSAAFLAAVEAAWQLHERWSGLLPRQLRAATAPAALGIRAVRGATWAAAILLTAVAARESAFSLVDAGFSAAQRCQASLITVIPRSGYLVWGSSTVSSAAADDISKAEGNAETAVVADSACRIGSAAAEDAMEKGLSPFAGKG